MKRLAEIDKTLLEHDTVLRDIYQKLMPLLAPPPEPPRRQIGFSVAQAAAVAGGGDSGKSTYDPAEQHASK